ncbi:S-methyl-5-thioribose-1-phosphate isomerase [Methanoculleus sp. YWC-01]|jgi:methylthioribose-1-phosphate isomerase|uniref:Putative methylthioribose-1-phosphate isomerase n=1 Tax=Methanoculleus nereidis TaxID=2735141 RepID=A0ABU3Z3S6_9EURY|nr:S-methyl-5-thioribose-1-phosphate isomerase [Methanoculleus sp. YWC-01]MCK9298032.1 S-methyl-5-thioribose-1-phosphate isomerase [Methanoculleus sp.]MDV4343255.1 S-methyl-5-thioribose-1-phosphate isomerase [Methanoculleus sp. YWC-01]PKL56132.1 MAG: S-methyl-5-thioribose-1-phosphate isomerase [Methanomicrobiales archaeon HGW-Methanomicrobiales-6]
MPEREEPYTIAWDAENECILYIDQTLLPGRYEQMRCATVDDLARAIGRLEIRGAPALGIAGAMGVALAAVRSTETDLKRFLDEVGRAGDLLRSTRPTAVNLAWGIDRVQRKMTLAASVAEAKTIAVAEANAVAEEDELTCRRLGGFGEELFPERCTVLTHCNAGALACRCRGTALGVIRSAIDAGKSVRVIACETRPLNQGSRLTCWELSRDGVDVTLIPDSSAAYLMRKGMIDLVVVGADRITKDAVFNKIGTYMHAVAAHHHKIPFYVAAPVSTFDLARTEEEITVEERDRSELAYCGDVQLVPDDVKVLNYAFDATPLDLVDAIVTEIGVLRPPYAKSFRLVGKGREA